MSGLLRSGDMARKQVTLEMYVRLWQDGNIAENIANDVAIKGASEASGGAWPYPAPLSCPWQGRGNQWPCHALPNRAHRTVRFTRDADE